MNIKQFVIWTCTICKMKAEVASMGHRPPQWQKVTLLLDGIKTEEYPVCRNCLGQTGAAWAMKRQKTMEAILKVARKFKPEKKKK